MPRVSVLMPVYNGCSRGNENFLRQAIESIRNQSFQEWEMVIVDDGSTDDTPRILREYAAIDQRIRIKRNDTNMKIVAALNIGAELCDSPLIARQDADDYSAHSRLGSQYGAIMAKSDVAALGTAAHVVSPVNEVVGSIVHPADCASIRRNLRTHCAMVHGSVMFWKQVFLDVGRYSDNPDYEYAEDYELWTRMSIIGHKMANLQEKLYYHRNHPGKSSAQYAHQQARATRLIATKAASIK